MRQGKSIKIFINYFLGPLLFAWLSISIYRQVTAQSHLAESWQHIQQSLHSPRISYLVLAVALMGLNWGLEAAKWKASVRDIHPISFLQAFKAVLSGVSISVTMPNRVGEYLGRMMYMPEGKRLKIIAVTLIGSAAQLLVTLAAGALGLIVLQEELVSSRSINPVFFTPLLMGVGAVTLILTGFYFNLARIEKWLERFAGRASWFYMVQAVQGFGLQRLLLILCLSAARYAVFVLQYILLFWLFEVEVSAATLIWSMSLVFLALAVIPTLAVVVEFGVRGEVCLQVVGLFTTNSLGILLTSVSIWVVNLIIPALVGSLLILGIKIFNRRERVQSPKVS